MIVGDVPGMSSHENPYSVSRDTEGNLRCFSIKPPFLLPDQNQNYFLHREYF
jgi:hypothetical protein